MNNIKIEAEKGHEIVKRVILGQIKDGTLLPGTRLPSVVDFAASFGVGRSTMREALSALKATGWIEVKHGGGTFVSKVLPTEQQQNPFNEAKNVREILEVRKWLESGAVAAAAKHRTEEDIMKLEHILSLMQQASDQNDAVLSEKTDIDFHLAIASASHNQLLNELMISLTSKLADTMGKTRQLWFNENSHSSQLLLDEHRSIFEAIKAQDEQLAISTLQEHLKKVQKVLKQ